MKEHEFTKSEAMQVKRLIRKECCNNDQGNCMLAFDGLEHACPQERSIRLVCKWFIEAVLPLEKKLQEKLQGTPNIQMIPCEICGKEIVKKCNRTKYCERCSMQRRRRKKAHHMAIKRRVDVDI